MTKFILIFCFFIHATLNAANVRMGDEDNPIIRLISESGNSLTLYTEEGSGNAGSVGTTQDGPYQTYVPIDGNSGNSSNDYFFSPGFIVPDIRSTTGGLGFNLNLDNDNDSSLRLMIAVKTNEESLYTVAKDITSSAFISFDDICDADSELINCSDFESTIDEQNDDLTLFIYYVDPDIAANGDAKDVGDEFTPADKDFDGLYINLNLSADVKNYSDGSTLLNDVTVRRGDASLFLSYRGSLSNEADLQFLAIYDANNSDAFFRQFELVDKEGGQFTVTNLENGVSYSFKAAYVDKFGWRSDISDATVSTAPAEVEALLSETQCYLITAGFGRDHYVLDYFRYIRDQYLLKTFVGKKFVDFYYATAPSYVKFILNNPLLAKLIRAMSYTLYFIMNNFIFVGAFIITILLGISFIRQSRRA